MLLPRLLFGLGVLLSVACAGTPTVPGQPSAEVLYHVAPPDVLEIIVRPEPTIQRAVTVRPDGYVSIDLLGDIQVEGKTVQEIRKEITSRITDFIVAPDVAVTLVQSNSRRFYVLGQVSRPGVFPLIGRVTVTEALAQAGGATILASLNTSRLVRPEEDSPGAYAIHYDDIVKKGDLATNYELQPGDLIYVPPGLPARIGFAIQSIFYPVQAIFGLGGGFGRMVY
jgi:polysaccharide export outer membrane protein